MHADQLRTGRIQFGNRFTIPLDEKALVPLVHAVEDVREGSCKFRCCDRFLRASSAPISDSTIIR
jgi:hypothetical protein